MAYIINNIMHARNLIGNGFSYTFDTILPKNPVTKKREFHTKPEFYEKINASWYRTGLVDQYGGYCLEDNHIKLIERIANRLKPNMARKSLEWEFIVTNSGIANAFAYSGGKVYITKGFIEGILKEKDPFGCSELSDEDKIAAVLCHEIIHVDARHHSRISPSDVLKKLAILLLIYVMFKAVDRLFYRKIIDKCVEIRNSFSIKRFDSAIDYLLKQIKKINDGKEVSLKKICLTIASVKILKAFFRTLGQATRIFIFHLKNVHPLSCRRNNEFEADSYGMRYLNECNYNPEATIWFLNFFKKHHARTTGYPKLDAFYNFIDSTHPTDDQRINAAELILAEIRAENRQKKAVVSI